MDTPINNNTTLLNGRVDIVPGASKKTCCEINESFIDTMYSCTELHDGAQWQLGEEWKPKQRMSKQIVFSNCACDSSLPACLPVCLLA
jgi:hypothetical protein